MECFSSICSSLKQLQTNEEQTIFSLRKTWNFSVPSMETDRWYTQLLNLEFAHGEESKLVHCKLSLGDVKDSNKPSSCCKQDIILADMPEDFEGAVCG